MKRILKSLRIFSMAFLFAPLSLLAQSANGNLSGHVTDSSGAVLQGASVVLVEDGRSLTTNPNGDFSFVGVAAGSYHVQVSFVGFEDSLSEVQVATGTNKLLRIALKVGSESEMVVVVAERVHGEAEAINRIKTGDNILQIATHEVITSLPNANMADAIGRMPSVTLDRDEGEGAYIQVRGTEPRLTNVTVNGNTIPSEEGGVRQIRMDAIASDLIGSIELNKTLSANQDADGIGGSVNFVTKTAEDKPSLSITGLGGFTPVAQGRKISQIAATAGKRFGADKKFGFLGGITYDFNGRGWDGIEPSFASGSLIYKDLQTREYVYYRSRWGLTGSADYKLSKGSTLYAKALYSEFFDYGNKWYYDYIQNSAPAFYTSSKRPTYGISNMSLGGKHFFGTNSLRWDMAGSYSWEDAAAGNPKADFAWLPATGTPSTITYTIDQTTNPKQPTFTPTNTVLDSIQNPANYVLIDAYTSSGRSSALSLSGSIDYDRIHRFGSRYGQFSMGAKVRNVHRGQNAMQNIYDLGGTGAKPTTSNTNSSYRMTNFLSNFTNPDYFNGGYKLGPVTDFDSIINTAVTSATPLLKLDQAKSNSKSATANYNLTERITAGYMMESVDLAKRLHLQFGLRFENTFENGSGFNYNTTTAVLAKTTPSTQSYLDVLPSAQLRYSPTANDNLRLVYSRGIARPNPLQLIPYINETDGTTTCPSGYTCKGTLSVGNPNLVAEYANSYDLLYERFLKPMGMIQAGFFYKDLSKPLFSTQTVMQYLGAYYSATQPVNGTDAYVYGFEISYQQRLTYLPGVLSGLGLNTNYSYSSSEAHGIPFNGGGATVYRTASLLRQAPHTWNIGPTYDRGRVSLRTGISYNSHFLYSYANVDPASTNVATNAYGPSGDQYAYAHTQVDAQSTVRLYKGLNLMVYGQNLTNEPFGYYKGDPAYMTQREYYKQTYGFGLKYNLGQNER